MELQRRAAESFLRSGYIDEGLSPPAGGARRGGRRFPGDALARPRSPRSCSAARSCACAASATSSGRLERIPPAELRRVDACWSAAQGLGMVDSLRGSYFQVRALLFSLAAGDPYRIARSLALELGFVATAGPSERSRVEELFVAARCAAERSEHPHAFAMVTALSGVRLFLEGRFREALPVLDEGVHLLRSTCLNTAWEIGSTLTFQLWSLWWLGDYRAFCERASPRASARPRSAAIVTSPRTSARATRTRSGSSRASRTPRRRGRRARSARGRSAARTCNISTTSSRASTRTSTGATARPRTATSRPGGRPSTSR